MAEQLVFGADIDNVTIKNINGKLTAVIDVEDGEDEFEVVTNYVEPQEDDEFYVESVFAKFRHKATQLLTDAFKKEKKPRSAPVNESLTNPLSLHISENSGSITLSVDTTATSQIDGKVLTYSDYNPVNTHIVVSKSEYPNAKVFNTAHAGKTITLTTKKRYAESEGHPVVKPIEISVEYPTFEYVEGTSKARIEDDTTHVNAKIAYYRVRNGLPDEFSDSKFIDAYNQAVTELDASTITMHYELTTTEGQVIAGDAPINQESLTNQLTISVNRSTIPEYNSHTFKSEKWTLAPITVEGFNFKAVISFEPYVKGTL